MSEFSWRMHRGPTRRDEGGRSQLSGAGSRASALTPRGDGDGADASRTAPLSVCYEAGARSLGISRDKRSGKSGGYFDKSDMPHLASGGGPASQETCDQASASVSSASLSRSRPGTGCGLLTPRPSLVGSYAEAGKRPSTTSHASTTAVPASGCSLRIDDRSMTHVSMALDSPTRLSRRSSTESSSRRASQEGTVASPRRSSMETQLRRSSWNSTSTNTGFGAEVEEQQRRLRDLRAFTQRAWDLDRKPTVEPISVERETELDCAAWWTDGNMLFQKALEISREHDIQVAEATTALQEFQRLAGDYDAKLPHTTVAAHFRLPSGSKLVEQLSKLDDPLTASTFVLWKHLSADQMARPSQSEGSCEESHSRQAADRREEVA
eukprot:gnl/TRDRNA2_/TRDRNA2_173844_c1_seq12.p1 gnl/TRDRNA2_/TRDRNA2_173844_c1~~gnl/TRDRNA2_/TRDRNA2_173844_c1_seq12.p1  ORF type:complete len:380 (+),score=29.73 gnl/TRDRNA2_/TRDRNA2_173844_c1_seq12:1-1140(+)